jgi:glycosyltransferase involved in cell wall biosynthesis
MALATPVGDLDPMTGRSSSMRIVLSNSSSSWGGVHKVTEILARELQSRGHEVTVFGSAGKMLEQRMRDVAPFEPILGGMDFNPVVLARVTLALRRNRPDVVLTLMKKDITLTAPVAAAMGIPVIVRHANQRPLGSGRYWKKLFGDIPSLHITNAAATKMTLLESSPFLSPEDIEVIYNGIDPAPFETARAANLGLPPGSVAIGFIGSFEARKGVIELSRAWSHLSAAFENAHLILVGKGSMEAKMRDILKDVPRVHWTGYRTDIASILRALDLLVLPSYVEGAPNVVLEAMCAGTPIVATAVSGTPELVRDGMDARLVAPRNTQALIEGLIQMLSDRDLRERMAASARARVGAEFGLGRMIDEYEAAMRGVQIRAHHAQKP